MIYVLAIFLPPLAVLLRGRPVSALVNLLLCCLFWLPGVIHAWMVISDDKAQARQRELLAAMQGGAMPPAPRVPTVATPMPVSSRFAIVAIAAASLIALGWMIQSSRQRSERIAREQAEAANTFPTPKTPALSLDQRGAN